MPVVSCKLKDSASNPLVGFLRVTSDYIIVGASVDGSVIVPAFRDTPLVNGSVSLELAPSDRAKVTYLFQVYQSVGLEDILVWEFRAKVPDSAVPVDLAALEPTGLTHDAQDSSVLTVTRRILADEIFWQRLKSDTLKFKGGYSPSQYYRRGDAVVYLGSSYVMTFDGVIINEIPYLNTTKWLLIAAKGEAATNPNGADASFSTAWQNDQAAPSKNAVFGMFSLLAPKNYAQLSNAVTLDTLDQYDYTKSIPYTKWVQDRCSAFRALGNQDAVQYAETARLNAIATSQTYTDNQVSLLISSRIPRIVTGGSYITTTTRQLVEGIWFEYYKQVLSVPAGGCKSLFVQAQTTMNLTTVQPLTIFLGLTVPGLDESDRAVYPINQTMTTLTQSYSFNSLPAGTYNITLRLQTTGNGTVTAETTKIVSTMFF